MALADAGLVAMAGGAAAGKRRRHRPRGHLPGPQGRPAALLGRGARGAPDRQGARAGTRAGQAAFTHWPQPTGCGRRSCRRAFGLKIRGVATPSRLRAGLAAVALERAFGNQIKAGLAGKLGLSAKAGRLLAGQLAQEAARFRHRRPPGRGAGRRARGRDAGRPCRAAPGRAAPLPRRARQAGARVRARRQRLPSRGRGWSRRRLRPRRSSDRAGRPDLAGFAQEVRRHADSARAGLARQPQGLHQPRLASAARAAPRVGPVGDRVQVHADRGAPGRQPGARQRRSEGRTATSRYCRSPPSSTRTPCSISSASTADAQID